MQIAKERWGEAEILTGDAKLIKEVKAAEEQRLRDLQSKEGQNGNWGADPVIGKQRFRDTKKQVNLRKRKAKRKKTRKSRKAA